MDIGSPVIASSPDDFDLSLRQKNWLNEIKGAILDKDPMSYDKKRHEQPNTYSPDIKYVQANITNNSITTSDNIIKESCVMESSPSLLKTLSIRHVSITNFRKLKGTSLEKPPMAYRPH